MRIVAGKWRGQTLRQPPESITRPTTDRVREALFSALESRIDFEGLRVLDAFAGSGALGLEALSRGAEHVTFCEMNGKVLPVLKKNVASLPGAAGQSRIVRADALKVFGGVASDSKGAGDGGSHSPTQVRTGVTLAEAFGLVLLDPPYAMEAATVAGLVRALDEAGLLAADAVVHYEHAKKDTQAAQDAFKRIQWETAVAKRYGDIAFDLFKRKA